MNQKFINNGQRTQRKQVSSYQSQKSKRFTRKRSTQSDRSIDSRQSKYSSNQTLNIVKDFNLNQPKSANKIHLNMDDFSQHLITSIILTKQLTPSKARYNRLRNDRNEQTKQINRNNKQIKQFNVDYHAVIAQLQVRNKQIQVLISQHQCIKLIVQQQRIKNKRIQEQKVEISSQLSQKSKQVQKYQIDNKKLIQQKKILMKQIQFLQKINYDQKTRNVQSYRQKYLQKQIQELRKKIQLSKSDLQRQLQEQIQKISNQKYNIQNLNKALKVANQTLIKNIQKNKIQQKSSIFHSQQYKKLRQKYKMCLDAYKNLKIQYSELQKQLNKSLNHISQQNILNSNSQLSIVLSSSSSQASLNIGKENQNYKNQQSILDAIQTAAITPIKNLSLSPRNRMETISLSSPKNITKSSLNLNQKKSTPTSYRYKCQSTNKSKQIQNTNNQNYYGQKV